MPHFEPRLGTLPVVPGETTSNGWVIPLVAAGDRLLVAHLFHSCSKPQTNDLVRSLSLFA